MKYTIIVDKQSRINPSEERKQYEIDIEELRTDGTTYDSLIITREETYVMRRLSLSEYHVLTVLEEPIKEPLTELNIELFEGDNYIYLIDMTGNKFYAEYLIKNDFTDLYVTLNEMNSAINQTAQQIESTVNQKLTGYATNEDITELNSTITQKAGEINAEVSKKVNNEDYTKANIILKINDNTSQAKINADVVELSANDILNLLAGNAINLTSKNIIISSDKFSVDKNGKVTCSDINITGGEIILKDASYSQPKFTTTGTGLGGYSGKTTIYPDGVRTKVNEQTLINLSIGTNSDNNPFGILVLEDNKNTTYVRSSGIETPKLTQTSLKSKKKNIKKLNVNALDLIKNSDICLYNLKGEKAKSKKHIGLVIGEGYNCPNEVISEDGQGVEQYSMTSLAWKAIQELIQENNNLRQRIEKLEVQNGNSRI